MAEPKYKSNFCSCNSWAVSFGSSSCYSPYIFPQTVEMAGCLHALVLHRSDMNPLMRQEEELEVLWVAMVGKVHTFTDNLSREMYPTACSGLQLAKYSWVQRLLWSLHPWPDFQENSVHWDAVFAFCFVLFCFPKDPLETWPVFGCKEGLSWKAGPNNHGQRWKNYFCCFWHEAWLLQVLQALI